MSEIHVPFSDIKNSNNTKKEKFHAALDEVLKSGQFILGEKLEQFESEFANFLGISKGLVVGVANGSDALRFGLLAKKFDSRDEIIVAANTYFAAAAAVTQLGLSLKFCDVDINSRFPDKNILLSTFNKKTRGYIKSHLYGGAEITEIDYKSMGVEVINDCSQAHGTKVNNKFLGNEEMSTYSFYPTKNIGALGDAGAIITFDEKEHDLLIKLRNQGTSKSKYIHDIIGYNSRLDELQAAFLIVQLKYFEEENSARKKIYDRYVENLKYLNKDLVVFNYPKEINPTHHIFQVRIPGISGREVIDYLDSKQIKAMQHYPIPLHLQPAFLELGYQKGDFPNSETLAKESISLPLYPSMTDNMIDYVSEQLSNFISKA